MNLHPRRPPAAAPADQAWPISVTVVESEGCHYCADGHAALTQLIADGVRLNVTVVDARSTEGTALLRRHRAAMMPLILLDGQFFSQGRLPQRKLARRLANQVEPSPAATGEV